MKRLTTFALGATAAWLAGIAVFTWINFDDARALSLNEWGDVFGGVFAPLALFWLVIGYFQHGEELRLNTEALKAQQAALQRQVEETEHLVEAAKLQAQVVEQDLKDRQSREAREAKLEFVFGGQVVSGPRIETEIRNRGGEAHNIEVTYDSPHSSSFSPSELVESNGLAELVIIQDSNHPLEWPIRFGISCTDCRDRRHKFDFELSEAGKIEDISADPN